MWFLCVVFYKVKRIGVNSIVYKSLVLFYFVSELLFFYIRKDSLICYIGILNRKENWKDLK